MAKTDKKNNFKSNKENNLSTFFLLSCTVIVVITLSIYLKSINNDFTNWDDNHYVTENKDITTLHGDSIVYTLKNTFTDNVMGNYHPLTMLSFCIEYNFFKFNTKAYHFTNVFLHIINSLLVFVFIWLLSKQKWTSFITSLLFAIHPMHVESVSWISERKDLLYAFFYMLSLIAYIFYIKHEQKKWFYYIAAFILFVFSSLSKGMAVSLPVTFFVVDYFFERKLNRKLIFEKVPFLILSIVFGIISIEAQKSIEAITDIVHYPLFDRILFISYSIMMYFNNLFFPFNLSIHHYYPLRIKDWYPVTYYISPLVVVLLLFLIYKSKKYGKEFWFGFGFFFVTIALVLQFIPVGKAVFSERYTYIPYIGLCYIIAHLLNKVIESEYSISELYRNLILSVSAGFVVMFIVLSYKRTKVWKDSVTLLTDAINKIDYDPVMYMGRSQAYYLAGQYQKSVEDCDKFFTLDKYFTDIVIQPGMYQNRGMAFIKLKKFNEALQDFNKTIELKKDYLFAHYYRGTVYYELKEYDKAIFDFSEELELNPNNENCYNDRGLVYYDMGKYEQAINDYNSAIKLNPHYSMAYLNRAMAFYNLGNINKAIDDYSMSIKIDPKFVNTYVNRGIAFMSQKKYDNALNDYNAAIKVNSSFDLAYLNRGILFYTLKKYNEAINDFSKSLELNPTLFAAHYYKINLYKETKQFDQALTEIDIASKKGMNIPQSIIDIILKEKKNK